MSMLREFVGPFLQICERYFGIKIDPIWGEVIVALSVLIVFSFAIHNTYLWARRRLLGDISALPEEQLAVVNLIARDVKGIKLHIEQAMAGLDTSIGGRLDEALSKLKTTDNDNVVEDDPKTDTDSGARTARYFIANQVKDAVLQKFVEGGWFAEFDEHLRHVYRFEGKTVKGQAIVLQLQTPYRSWNRDDHYDYVLEVWLDGYKTMNFEWSHDDGPWLRFLRVGDWVDEIVSWSVRRPTPEKLQAAE